MNREKNIKVIAFYLPQFHTIPENDRAHGKGFTEWTNTRKAKPIFEGHYQPKVPLDENYYCLLDEGVMKNQVEIAKKYGIYGFCYYHYWFKNGKKLLEKPIENMLNDKSIDMPFCLCWANENWTKRWDGGNNEVIIEQDYGNYRELLEHVDYLCDFFKDERYIKEDGKPILIIYKPEIIPNLKKVINIIKKRVEENGFSGIKLMAQYPTYYFNGVDLDYFDNYIQFQPVFIKEAIIFKTKSKLKVNIKKVLLKLRMRKLIEKSGNYLYNKTKKNGKKELTIRNYDEDWSEILNYKVEHKKLIAGAFVDWDNTARNKSGLLYQGGNPEKFGVYMKKLVKKVNEEYASQYIFINAWNEWAEGAYLEPDEKHGYSYLQNLKNAVGNQNRSGN